MSKAKGKEKKPQNYQALQKEYEQQRRELLDVTFTLRKMQQKSNLLLSQNNRLQRQRQQQYQIFTQKIEQLTIKNETNEKRLITMRNDLTNSEVQNKKLNNTILLLQKNMYDERIEKNKEYQELKKNNTFQIAKYQNMLTDYKLYMNQRDNRQKEIADLLEQRQIQVANRIRDVADKQREKVQATDKIRDQMGNKIRQMRQNLLSLKKQELQTTTRLTMLQNHQLTSQLEYQSKQTQKIVFKNQQLQSQITQLKQQLEIHKQVEDQLAKRSHFSKGIIKKLHLRVTELQQQLKRQQQKSSNMSEQAPSFTKSQKPQKSMISAVQKQLERSQKKYVQLHTRYEALLRQKDELSSKLQAEIASKSKLLNVVTKIYENIYLNKQNTQIKINLGQLKAKQVEQWSADQTKAVLQLLLIACKPLLTKQQLSHQIFNRIIVFEGQKYPYLPKLSTQRQKIINSNSENRLTAGFEDLSKQVKEELSKQKYSVNIASRMVIGKVREWGKTLTKSKSNLQRKYKLSATFRS